MGIKQLYNDNLRKLPNEYVDVSVMIYFDSRNRHECSSESKKIAVEIISVMALSLSSIRLFASFVIKLTKAI